MNKFSDIKIESKRLSLIPVNLKYVDEIVTHFQPEITNYMWPRTPKTQEEVEKHIKSQIEKMKNKSELMMVILLKKNQEFLGIVSLHQVNTQYPELGVWLKQLAHGNQYGREAVQALIKWAEENLIYKYLKYPVDKRNKPSCKLAESLGGKVEDEYVKKSESGFILDEVEYRFHS